MKNNSHIRSIQITLKTLTKDTKDRSSWYLWIRRQHTGHNCEYLQLLNASSKSITSTTNHVAQVKNMNTLAFPAKICFVLIWAFGFLSYWSISRLSIVLVVWTHKEEYILYCFIVFNTLSTCVLIPSLLDTCTYVKKISFLSVRCVFQNFSIPTSW